MPELPEVETMVRGLRPVMEGFSLVELEIHDPSLIRGIEPDRLIDRVAGSRIDRIERRGKWVVFHLALDAGIIVVQPRMTGGFWLISPARIDHARLTFRLREPERSVWYCDARRLGRIHWFACLEDALRAFTRSHGPDAIAIEIDELVVRLKGTNRGIKPTLMDQKILAGVGNIYADEILFSAKIHPQRKASSLNSKEIERIHDSIGVVLAKAIAAEGSSFDAGYRTVLGLEGGFLAMNAVYGREGAPCPDCGSAIIKGKIQGLIGRPTYHCPHCQVLGRARKKRSTLAEPKA